MKKIGISGFGRIGRTIFREWLVSDEKKIEISALNNLFKSKDVKEVKKGVESLIHLLRYDTTHGTLSHDFELSFLEESGKFFLYVLVRENQKKGINKAEYKIRFFTESSPDTIPWDEENIELVVDCTGVFKTKTALSGHIKGSVKKVIMSAPGEGLDATFVMGVNENSYDDKIHHIVSNASCTTNCLAPLVRVLDEAYGIEMGLVNTIHSYTMDQMLIDNMHSDLRRARSATQSMIPTTTGAAKAIGEVLPKLKGKLDGTSVRVPTQNVSLVDLTVQLKTKTTKKEINELFQKAKKTDRLKGVLDVSDKPLVSIDFNGNKHSSIVDLDNTQELSLDNGNQMFKILSWYDNETGYSNRVLDLASHMLK